MRFLPVLLVTAFVLTACSSMPTTTSTPSEEIVSETTELTNMITVALTAQNNSGQNGTATLTETEDGKVVVSVEMTGGNFTEPQPAHIHVGSCPKPGAVEVGLTDLVDGMSETTVDMTMDELMASSEHLAINVHKSAAEASHYTACGDLK